MNKKTTLTIIVSLILFLVNAQTENQQKIENYQQGFNNTINVNFSAMAILDAVKNQKLPNGKEYNPNENGKDLKRDFQLFKNSYGKQNLETLKRNIIIEKTR